ncbi:hypothetical protein SELMODRAFT_422349 [Selaginella moellendorffii]|uniref:Uncharacterized protein n=1 Tax=Selaginella moellendorffii TaxID=88036 RepID=D8SI45_SELML|nr:hypothetical protein SELMODRAFT_422349 [Selaginella moellendorffii]
MSWTLHLASIAGQFLVKKIDLLLTASATFSNEMHLVREIIAREALLCASGTTRILERPCYTELRKKLVAMGKGASRFCCGGCLGLATARLSHYNSTKDRKVVAFQSKSGHLFEPQHAEKMSCIDRCPKLIDFQEFYKDARTPQVFLPVWSAAEIALAWQEVFDPIQFMGFNGGRSFNFGEVVIEGRTIKFGEVVEVEKLDDLQHPIPVNRTIWLESPVEETVNTFIIRKLPGKSVRGTSTTAIRSGAFLLEDHFMAVASELVESDGVDWHSSSGQRFIRKKIIRTGGNRIGKL